MQIISDQLKQTLKSFSEADPCRVFWFLIEQFKFLWNDLVPWKITYILVE